jgi:aryl-alcohol dehydrogenase-like predicted oxidoreductase
MQSLRPIVSSGAARRIGVGNFTLEQWQAAERALRGPVIANQVRFSLANPGPAGDLVPYAAERDRLVVAYSPLGQGLLAWSGATPPRAVAPNAGYPDSRDGAARERVAWPPVPESRDACPIVTRSRDDPRRIAMRGLSSQPGVMLLAPGRHVPGR